MLVSFISVRPSVCPRVSTRLPLHRFSWLLILGTFRKYLSRKPQCFQRRTKIPKTLRENQSMFTFSMKQSLSWQQCKGNTCPSFRARAEHLKISTATCCSHYWNFLTTLNNFMLFTVICVAQNRSHCYLPFAKMATRMCCNVTLYLNCPYC